MFARPSLLVRRGRKRPLVGYGVLKRETECASLTWEYCSPTFPSGKVLLSDMEVLTPPFLRVSPEIVPP